MGALLYWLVVASFAIGTAYATSQLRDMWRQSESAAKPPRGLPWSAITYRGLRRSAPVGVVTSCFMVVAAVVVGPDATRSYGPVGSALLSVSGIALLAGGALATSIYLYGRPKSFIPPGLSEEAGAVAERRRRRRQS